MTKTQHPKLADFLDEVRRVAHRPILTARSETVYVGCMRQDVGCGVVPFVRFRAVMFRIGGAAGNAVVLHDFGGN